MKKFLTFALLFAAAIIFVPSMEAKTDSSANRAIEANYQRQNRYYQRQRRNNGRVRVVTQTRIVRIGYRRYREVVQYRYLPNGRVTVRVLSRTRIR
ncbi:hypothetical protein BH10ACI1_BH10ACI1_05970 [soil metagenome]